MPFYLIHTSEGLAIREMTSLRQARCELTREVGTDNLIDVTPALPAQIDWVRQMGGAMPESLQALPAGARHQSGPGAQRRMP